MDTTALTLFGRARFKVLAHLFGMPGTDAIHLRELARRIGISPTATQYELRLLVTTGLVLQDDSSGRPLYRGNRKHPIANELRGMIRKMDATRETEAITDDSFWTRKRTAQKADYASQDLGRKSTFLAKSRKFAGTLSANIGKKVNYEY